MDAERKKRKRRGRGKKEENKGKEEEGRRKKGRRGETKGPAVTARPPCVLKAGGRGGRVGALWFP